LGPDYKPVKKLPNCIDNNRSFLLCSIEHPGHIWAFQRKWYEESNIPDLSIVGAGDIILATAVKGITYKNSTYILYEDY
jgi:hypothetical protein